MVTAEMTFTDMAAEVEYFPDRKKPGKRKKKKAISVDDVGRQLRSAFLL